jgi:hypothetical protein
MQRAMLRAGIMPQNQASSCEVERSLSIDTRIIRHARLLALDLR